MSAEHRPELSVQLIGIAAQPPARADYEVAGLGRRLVAAILDFMCLCLINLVVFLVLDIMRLSLPFQILSLVVGISYFGFFWARQHGQTPGKHATGIRVIRVDGEPITGRTVAARYVGYYVNTLALCLGWIALLFDADYRGWHDRLAGTVVIMSHAHRASRNIQNRRILALVLGTILLPFGIWMTVAGQGPSGPFITVLGLALFAEAFGLVNKREPRHIPEPTPDSGYPRPLRNGETDDRQPNLNLWPPLQPESEQHRPNLHQPPLQEPDFAPRPLRRELMESVTAEPARVSPAVTYALIVLNVLIFLLTTGQKPYVWGATIHNFVVHGGEYYRLVSAMFLHANLEHVFFNMLALFMTGRLLERYIGHARLLSIYLAGGLVGSLASTLLNDHVASLGASGAVFAVFGAALVLYLRHGELLDEKARKQFRNAGGTIALNFINGIRPESGIDNWAHLGGLLGGIGIALLVYIRFTERPRAYQPLAIGLVILTLILSATAVPVLSARTISEGNITLRVPAGWHVGTNLDSEPFCQQQGTDCLMLLLAPSGMVYEVDRFSGPEAWLTLEQFDEAVASATKQAGMTPISRDEIAIDGVDAIQRVYQTEQTNRLLALAKEDDAFIRLLGEGESGMFDSSRAEIDSFIASIHFNDEPATDTDAHVPSEPADAEGYYTRGYAYTMRGDYARAIADYDAAIRLDPDFVDAYNDRGFAYLRQGDRAQAIADFDEAIRLDPGYANAYYNRGLAYYMASKYDLALADLTEYRRLAGETAEPLVLNMIAWLETQQKE